MDSVINWLCEEKDKAVRYRTLIELCNRDKSDTIVKDSYNNLLESEELDRTINKFQEKSKWGHVDALMTIAEYGLTREDVQIDAYVDRLTSKFNKGMKCAKVLLLRNLVALGYYEHPWVNEQISQSFANVREDGTVRCLDNNKKRNDSRLLGMGCYRQTTTYLLLAAELKKQGIVLPQYNLITKFYQEHDVMYHMNEDDNRKPIIEELTGTYYPIDHVHIGLQVIMYGLSILGAAADDRCQAAWDRLYNFRAEDGRYILSDSFTEPYFSIGEIGKTNKWVTLYVMLAEKNMKK